IGLRQDLEAELGVDSIKRVEILGSFEKMLPAAAAGAVRAKMDELGRARTLAAVVDLVLAAAPARPAPRPEPAADGHSETARRPRFVMRASPAEIPWVDGSRTLRGLHLLTAEPTVAGPLAEVLRQRGAKAGLLDAAACASPEALERAVAQLRAEHGP